MTLDNMTGITKGSYTGFCKSQLITCNLVKTCNGVCPFEDALKHADKTQAMNDQHINHDRDWIIGCIQHDGFIHTHRFDKANQIILDALSAEAESRLYIKIYADDEPSVKAEKLYQICGETQNREVAEWLKEYFPSAPDSRQRGVWVTTAADSHVFTDKFQENIRENIFGGTDIRGGEDE